MKDTPTKLVAIADDHIMFRKGTVGFINSYPSFGVIIEADNGKELIELIDKSGQIPDIAVVDINMPVMNGYETVNELKKRWPEIRILILTMITDEFSIIRMLRNGAKGYLLKASHPDELHKGLLEVYDDRHFSSKVVSNSVFKAISHRRDGLLFPELSDIELQVLTYYCKGYENKDIANELGTSHRTIDTYRNALFEKLDVHNRVELVVFALRTGLVSFD